ncbi:MAG: GNAT family N-acetyltransferase [Candidatus Dojkabacteria bacterium]
MNIRVILNPTREQTMEVLYFQFGAMEWDSENMENEYDRYATLPFGYVIAEDSKPLGAINLLKRKINYEGKEIILGGLGGVCTHKEHRKKGIGTQMLKEAMIQLKKEGCDIAFLNTDLDELSDFYGKVGFVPLNRDYKATGKSGKEYTDKGGMIAPLNSVELFNLVKETASVFDIEGNDW